MQQGFTALDYAKEKGQQEVVGYINSYLNGEAGNRNIIVVSCIHLFCSSPKDEGTATTTVQVRHTI